MFNLRLHADWEEQAAMLILAGKRPCWICMVKSRDCNPNGNGSYLCKNCRWRYARKQWHAVIHYILRAEHKLRGTMKDGSIIAECHRCKRFYNALNCETFALPEDKHESESA